MVFAVAGKGRTYRYITQEPLFPFGYGLSYTTFRYGVGKLNATQINPAQTVLLTFDIENTGGVGSEEVRFLMLSI
jgi:beta-glucosidase